LSEMVGFFMILVLFVVFLLPFDRRIIERYIMRMDAAPVAPASSRGGIRFGKLMMDYGFSDTTMTVGPYARQLCNMLDLEVVSFARRKFFLGSWLVELAIGRWNEEAREFEVVTEWCETWEDLEEEARQSLKSFRGHIQTHSRAWEARGFRLAAERLLFPSLEPKGSKLFPKYTAARKREGTNDGIPEHFI
jgi:hypothetical protein